MNSKKDISVTPLALSSTDLALERTVLAHERTLMAWIRTATSMISFGFTIYKLLHEASEKQDSDASIFTPRVVGMTMIVIGLLGLLLAQLQHFAAIKKLKQFYPDIKPSVSSLLSILILMFGVVLFLGAFFRQ